MHKENPCHAVTDSFKFKKLEKNRNWRAICTTTRKYYWSVNLERQKAVTGIKILTPNNVLTWLQVLLAQGKAENSLHKLKSEIRQILYHLH